MDHVIRECNLRRVDCFEAVRFTDQPRESVTAELRLGRAASQSVRSPDTQKAPGGHQNADQHDHDQTQEATANLAPGAAQERLEIFGREPCEHCMIRLYYMSIVVRQHSGPLTGHLPSLKLCARWNSQPRLLWPRLPKPAMAWPRFPCPPLEIVQYESHPAP
jgi:hypothetical protein